MPDLAEAAASAPRNAPDSAATARAAVVAAQHARPRPLIVGLGLFGASLAVCVFTYLLLAVQGPWFTSERALHWTPSQMGISRGSGRLQEGELVLSAPDAAGATVVSLETSLRSSSYHAISWQSSGVPDDVEVALLWHNDYEPARVFNRRLTVEAGRIQPFSLEDDRDWNGTINGLALGIKGAYAKPIIIRGVTAKTMRATEVLGDRVREWFTFEPWSGSSINLIIGGADVQDLPMPFTVGTIIGVATLFYAALARWRPQWVGPSGALIIGSMFLAGWFFLDTRLQWNLARQAPITAQTYAGKSWRERHLAAEDGMLFAFMEKVRAKLPPPPARIFMVADELYFRDRGAYHLYPYNVFFAPWWNTMPPVWAVKPGDYFVVFQRRDVQYDASRQLLRWEGGPPVRAEMMLVEGGAALFRIL